MSLDSELRRGLAGQRVDVDPERDLQRVVRAGRRRRLLRRAGAGLVAVSLVVIGALGYGALFEPSEVEQVSEPGEVQTPPPEPGAPEGRERALGEPVAAVGLSATVVDAGFRADFPAVRTGGVDVLRAEVRVVNVSLEPRDASRLAWRLQTPNGELLNPVSHGADDALRQTEVAPGGRVSGSVVFDIGDRRGTFFVMWQPSGVTDEERGVWPATIGDTSDCQPWVECPEASWLMERLGTAGFQITGDTESAFTATGNGAAFYASTTDGAEALGDEGYERVGEVDGVEVLGDGIRLTWMAERGRVWVFPGPSPGDEVEFEHIRRLVRVTTGA